MNILIAELLTIYDALEEKSDIIDIAYHKTKRYYEKAGRVNSLVYRDTYIKSINSLKRRSEIVDRALMDLCKDYTDSELRMLITIEGDEEAFKRVVYSLMFGEYGETTIN